MTTTLTCNFPGCGREVKPETALVPKIEAIRQAEGGKPISTDTLAKHVFCEEHGALGRGFAGGMFSYVKSVEHLEQRAKERTAAKSFFAKYGAPAPKQPAAPGKPAAKPEPAKNAMQLAFDRAKVTSAPAAKPATQKVVELPVAAAASA